MPGAIARRDRRGILVLWFIGVFSLLNKYDA